MVAASYNDLTELEQLALKWHFRGVFTEISAEYEKIASDDFIQTAVNNYITSIGKFTRIDPFISVSELERKSIRWYLRRNYSEGVYEVQCNQLALDKTLLTQIVIEYRKYAEGS